MWVKKQGVPSSGGGVDTVVVTREAAEVARWNLRDSAVEGMCTHMDPTQMLK